MRPEDEAQLAHLTTEARNPDSERIDSLSALEIVHLINGQDALVPPAIAARADNIAQAIDVIAARFRQGGRLVYVGAGTSGRLGVLDAAECPPTFRTPPEMVVGLIAGGPPALVRAVEGLEDKSEQGAKDLARLDVSERDAVVSIATSGRTPYCIGAADEARRRGAFTIGLVCNRPSRLDGHVDLLIAPIVGPEVISGSTRMKAGTATKMVLNMLTTGAMVRIGKTFGNLMVDLKPTNSKLWARARRIISGLCGVSLDEAAALLSECDGEVKTALVAGLAGVGSQGARAQLEAAGGHIRLALDQLKQSRSSLDASGTRRPPPQKGDRHLATKTNAAENTVGSEPVPLWGPPPGTRSVPLILGIDGGGTSTTALLADLTGNVLGRGKAGPSNAQVVGTAAARSAILDAVAAAFDDAGRPRAPVQSACLGLAGAGRDEDQCHLRRWALQQAIASHVQIVPDAFLLFAAHAEPPTDACGDSENHWGIAVIAGTGSMVLGRSPDGETARAGGWGPLLGDQGSAYWIATEALREVARSADHGVDNTLLSKWVLEALSIQDPTELVGAFSQGKRSTREIAQLAPLVDQAAAAGDPQAATIIDRAASELADQVVAVASRLSFSVAPVPVILSGSTLLGIGRLREALYRSLRDGPLQVELRVVREPATGAVRLAGELLRSSPSE